MLTEPKLFLRSSCLKIKLLLPGILAATIHFSSAATFNTGSIADAFVATGPTGGLSSSNFGAAGALAVSAGNLPQGEFQTVIKFDLSNVRNSLNTQFGAGSWSLQSVTLQLSASPHNNAIFNNISAGQFNVSLLQNNSWVEGTGTGGIPSSDGISFNSLQNTFINNATDQALGTFNFVGGSSGTGNYSLTLSPGIIEDLMDGSDLSLRLSAADAQVSYLFAARSTGTGPNLIFSAVPEPTATALLVVGFGILLWRRRSVKLKQSGTKLPPEASYHL